MVGSTGLGSENEKSVGVGPGIVDHGETTTCRQRQRSKDVKNARGGAHFAVQVKHQARLQ